MTRSESEKSLLEGLKKGEKAAAEAIYKSNFRQIRSMILQYQGQPEDAADIFQEAIIVLYQKLQQPDFHLHCQIGTYLFSVSKNLWLKKLNKNRHFQFRIEEEEEYVSVNEDLALHEEKENSFRVMEKALENIGEPCRSLLRAFYMEGRPMQQIASDFGYTNADNAKTQKYKCLVRLKKLFFEDNNK